VESIGKGAVYDSLPSLNVETIDDDDVNDNTVGKAIPSSMILMLVVFVEGTGSSS